MLARDLRRTSRLALVGLAARRRAGWLLAALAFGSAGGLFSVIPWAMLARDTRVEAEGVRATGEIQRLRKASDGDGGTDYVIEYAVVLPSGGVVRGRSTAARRDWRALRVGGELAVLYDPAEPSTNVPADPRYSLGRVRAPGHALVMSTCGLPFVLGAGLVLYGVLVRLPGTWHRLLSRGQSAGGRVVAVEQNVDSDGDAAPGWRVRYAFRDRFGTPREGTTEAGPRALAEDWAEGDAGQVRYDPREPETSVWLGKGDLTFFR